MFFGVQSIYFRFFNDMVFCREKERKVAVLPFPSFFDSKGFVNAISFVVVPLFESSSFQPLSRMQPYPD